MRLLSIGFLSSMGASAEEKEKGEGSAAAEATVDGRWCREKLIAGCS